MRILIIESEEHYFLANTTVELFDGFGEVEVIIPCGLGRRNTPTKDWRGMLLPQARNRVVRIARHRWIFLSSFPRAHRADLILIQTGPEHGSTFKVLTYLTFCAVFGARTIVMLHGVSRHLSADGFRGWIRERALRMVRGAMFGTRWMRERFARDATSMKTKGPATAIVPVRLATEPVSSPVPPLDGAIRIGLLGGVTHKRRDFAALIAALQLLSAEVRARITLVTLGNCTKARCEEIVASLAVLVDVDHQQGFLTEQEFIDRGEACHLLLASLGNGLGYGMDRATGAIGDAIRLGRPLLINDYIDPLLEFDGILLPFRSSEHLASLLQDAVASPPTVHPGALAEFSRDSVLASVVADLGILAEPHGSDVARVPSPPSR